MVKSINKRIILGFVIALNLLLSSSVHALSCSPTNRTISHIIDNTRVNIPNRTSGGDMNIYFHELDTLNNNDTRIYFDNNDSYIDILVSISWTMSLTNNPVYNGQGQEYQFHPQSSPPMFYLVDDSGMWTQGVWDNGYYRVRYFKSQYKSNYVNLTQLQIGIPTWWNNYVNDTFVFVDGGARVEHSQCDSNKALKDAIDENTKAQEKTNDTLKDPTTDDPSSDITNMNSKIANNGSISQLLTLPITLYQSILNATTGSCSPFNLGSLYNHNLTLPCINLSNLLGSTLYNIIDILLCGSFILVFRKKMVDIFNHMTSLNDRGNELE